MPIKENLYYQYKEMYYWHGVYIQKISSKHKVPFFNLQQCLDIDSLVFYDGIHLTGKSAITVTEKLSELIKNDQLE